MKKTFRNRMLCPSGEHASSGNTPPVSGCCMILGGRLFDFRMAGPVLLSGDTIRGQASAWRRGSRKKTDRVQDKRPQSVAERHLLDVLRTASERCEEPQSWVKTGLNKELVVLCRMAGCIALPVHGSIEEGAARTVRALLKGETTRGITIRCVLITWWNSMKAF
jgi:hypothetical protein